MIESSNLNMAPGSDGISGLFYYHCWEIIKEPLLKVLLSIHDEDKPTASQCSSIMVFANKPKKQNSTLPSDKRRISLLNADMKIITGLEALHLMALSQHTLSPSQLVMGNDQRIQHGINEARDTINHVNKYKMNGGFLDLDFKVGFNNLVMGWVFKIMAKKGVHVKVIN